MRPNGDGRWWWCLFLGGAWSLTHQTCQLAFTEALVGFFTFFLPHQYLIHILFLNLSSCGCRTEHISVESVAPCEKEQHMRTVSSSWIRWKTLDNIDRRIRNGKTNFLIWLWNVLMIVLLSFNLPSEVHRWLQSVAGLFIVLQCLEFSAKTKQNKASGWRSFHQSTCDPVLIFKG